MTKVGEMSSFEVDFEEYWEKFAKGKASAGSDPFIKAFPRVKKEQMENPPTLFDATCGTGQDSFRLLLQGYNVIGCERNEQVYQALLKGLKICENHEKIKKIVQLRFSLCFGDAKTVLSSLKNPPDIIYFDPMYGEQKGRTALPRKEMQIFHEIVGFDEDAEIFLTEILDKKMAADRVVVKRPLKGIPLVPNPSYQLKGKSTRFDVYKTFF